MDEINITINGQEVKVRKGLTVLEAAQAAGNYIPTLCYDPDLEPYGSCRLCVVEIENMRGLPPACTTPLRSKKNSDIKREYFYPTTSNFVLLFTYSIFYCYHTEIFSYSFAKKYSRQVTSSKKNRQK